jgi:hypothetical protein
VFESPPGRPVGSVWSGLVLRWPVERTAERGRVRAVSYRLCSHRRCRPSYSSTWPTPAWRTAPATSVTTTSCPNEPPAPVAFMGLQQSLEPQVRCGCDRSTMYLWSSPDACREAVTAWAETAPSVFGPSLQMLDPEIRKHTCWCTPRVGVVMLSGQEAIARGAPPGTRGVVVPALFHAVGCNTKTGRA